MGIARIYRLGRSDLRITTTYYAVWILEAYEMRANATLRPSPTPVALYWLAVEEYLAYLITNLEASEPNDLDNNLRTIKLVLNSLSSESDAVLTRYRIFTSINLGKLADTGSEIWQSIDLLQKCRNCILHPKPAVRSFRENEIADPNSFSAVHKKLLVRLSSNNLYDTSGFTSRDMPDWYKCLSSEAVRSWARSTAVNFMCFIHAQLPITTGQSEYIRLCTDPSWLNKSR